MVGKIGTYNATQRIPEIALSGTMTDATAIYTCPTGKKAQVTYFFRAVAYGANTTIDVVAAGINLEQWVLSECDGMIASGGSAAWLQTENYKTRIGSFQLNAGENFHGHGAIADNETINYTVKILELPA